MPDENELARAELVDLGVDVFGAAEADLIPLVAAAKLIRGKKPGKNINLQTIQRYASSGRTFVIDGEQKRLILPTTYRGSTKYTTAAAVAEFNRMYGMLSVSEAQSAKREKILPPRAETRRLERARKILKGQGMRSG